MAATTAVPAVSSSPEKISRSALVILVLTWLRIDLFLSRLLSVTRTCFVADLVTGNIYPPVLLCGLNLSRWAGFCSRFIPYPADFYYPSNPLNLAQEPT